MDIFVLKRHILELMKVMFSTKGKKEITPLRLCFPYCVANHCMVEQEFAHPIFLHTLQMYPLI